MRFIFDNVPGRRTMILIVMLVVGLFAAFG